MLKDGPLDASYQTLSIGDKKFSRQELIKRSASAYLPPWLQELFQAAAKDAVFACLRGVSATILFLRWGSYDDACMVTGRKNHNGAMLAESIIRSLFREMEKKDTRASLEHQKVR